MALAPSIVINLPGFPFEEFPSVTSITALRALASAGFESGDNYVVDGATSPGDGGGGVFAWNDASVAADDGVNVIRPNDTTPGQAGRWILTGTGIFGTPAGAGQVGFSHAQTYPAGTIGAHGKMVVSPQDAPFNAVPGGVIDATAALTAAMDYCATTGLTLDLGGATFAVTGNIQKTYNDFTMRNGFIRQLAPNASNRRTLFFDSCQRLKLSNIHVYRNGTGSEGALNDAAGIWIANGSGHVLENLSASGASKGTGVAFISISNSYVSNCGGRDMSYNEPGATDDRVQGAWTAFCTNCTFIGLYGRNLTGNASGQPASRYTRGIAAGGNVRCSYVAPQVANVDQGVDFSGSDGNIMCTVLGGHMQDCVTWGLKIANSGYGMEVVGAVARDCGIAGFVVQGPSETGLLYKGEDIKFKGCKSYNAGKSGLFGSPTAGFYVHAYPGIDTSYPRNVSFEDCDAIDEQNTPTMQYGFLCDVDPATVQGKFNVLKNCRSYRHTVAESSGFQFFQCQVRGTGTQSFADSTPVQVNAWAVEDVDGCIMHDTVTNPERITIRVPGTYRIRATLVWATNGTKFRRAQLRVNGTNILGANNSAQAIADTQTSVTVETIRTCVIGDYFDVVGEQTSGGSLNLSLQDSVFSVVLMRN